MYLWKFLFTCFIILKTTGVFCQIEQGTILLNGGLRVDKTRAGDNYEANSFGIFPQFGYFFTDDFGLGGFLSYARSDLKIQNFPFPGQTFSSEVRAFNFSTFARHYFNFLDYRVFGQLDLRYNSVNDFGVFSSKIGLGANGFLNSNISLEGNVKYQFFALDTETSRDEVARGPLEVLFEIKPYFVERGDPASSLADDFLAFGSHIVGGSAGVRNDFRTLSEIWFSPTYGFFIAENFVFGGRLSVAYTDNRASNPVSFLISPFFRYYIRATDGLQVVPNFTFAYSQTKYRTDRLTSPANSEKNFQFIPGLGLHTFLAEGIGLFGNATLNLLRRPDTEVTSVDNSKQNILQFQLGLEYYLSGY
ncbi:MAG TPA: hypothetical protein PKC40_04945 [Saprospiraceae bacterium]|nr:hypothetical protein [Saprospiraceae bacterium]